MPSSLELSGQFQAEVMLTSEPRSPSLAKELESHRLYCPNEDAALAAKELSKLSLSRGGEAAQRLIGFTFPCKQLKTVKVYRRCLSRCSTPFTAGPPTQEHAIQVLDIMAVIWES